MVAEFVKEESLPCGEPAPLGLLSFWHRTLASWGLAVPEAPGGKISGKIRQICVTSLLASHPARNLGSFGLILLRPRLNHHCRLSSWNGARSLQGTLYCGKVSRLPDVALRRTASSVGLTEMKPALSKGAGWLTHCGLYLLQGGLILSILQMDK